ncbi:hypothetical protein AcW1_008771 [Taiwanofungus camphoratus]|nr:hypothetical protein AcW1_008771 [Antrodia cinnamomea]
MRLSPRLVRTPTLPSARMQMQPQPQPHTAPDAQIDNAPRPAWQAARLIADGRRAARLPLNLARPASVSRVCGLPRFCRSDVPRYNGQVGVPALALHRVMVHGCACREPSSPWPQPSFPAQRNSEACPRSPLFLSKQQ